MDKKIIFISIFLLFISISGYCAANFNGIDSKIQIPAVDNYLVLFQTRPFSVCGWVKPRNPADGKNNIIGTWVGTSNVFTFMVTAEKNIHVWLYKQNAVGWDIYSPVIPKYNVWYHFAFTYNGTTGICYLNGVPGAPDTVPFVDAIGVAHFWELGSREANNKWGDMLLADIRVYNGTVLSPARISWIMKNFGVQDSGLTIHWKLDKDHKDSSIYKWGCSPVGVAFPATSIIAVDNPPTYFEQDNQKD